MKKILITGGLGFIGSCFAIKAAKKGNIVINLDKMTYAANEANVAEISGNSGYSLVKGDICDHDLVYKILTENNVDWVVNFAAESHVDNSIKNADEFIKTNISGVFSMLKASLQYYQGLKGEKKDNFRFLHISTDEVFGSLKDEDRPFDENSQYQPNSPYSASKAASDHLVRAWFETYKLPVIITNCSNNFGPRQHKEKFIPTVINSCLSDKEIPIYGNGKNIRDWIYVDDHCHGIELALEKGEVGQSYCLGGENEIRNIEIANIICEILDKIKPRSDNKLYKEQIKFVEDRMGHDYRYAIDNKKAREKLGFNLKKSFIERLEETILWYIK